MADVDINPVQAQALALPTASQQDAPLDLALAAWLDAKARRTGSGRTLAIYSETMSRFRLRLQQQGLDLDAGDERAIALVAQAFANERVATGRRAGQPVAAGTYNQRLAVISSFYEFARKRRLLNRANPLEMLDRRPDPAYESATPLDARVVAERLAAIDQATEMGSRDYALLAVGLSTGRRLTELASLSWGDAATSGGVVTLSFQRAKGGKRGMRDELARPVGDALWRWAWRLYGVEIARGLPLDAPMWPSLERNSRGHRLTHQAISDLCRKRLGTTKVHALRHTFAHAMEAVGATPAEIQARLGHSSLQTTGRYLARLRSAENRHADELTALFGLK